MIRIIIIVVAILAVAAGGIFGAKMAGIDVLAMAGLQPGDLKNKAKQAAAAAAAAIPVVQPAFVDFGLLVVPVVLDHEVGSQAELVIRLQVPQGKVEHVATYLPRLQSAFLEAMINYVPVVLRSYGNLDNEALRQRLLNVSKTVFPGEIEDVIIENAILHKL